MEETPPMPTIQKNDNAGKYLVPLSIITAGVIIAGAVFWSNRSTTSEVDTTKAEAENIAITPLGTDEHILGSPNAPVVLVEYSDAQCPFCKQFHLTMQKVITGEYGKNGKVAWVYRNFPLTQIHPDANRRANASECVASLGGNSKFWDFIDKVYTNTNFNSVNIDLPGIAMSLGIPRTDFNSCLDSKKFEQKIKDETENAALSGGRGTPHNVIVLQNKMSDEAKIYMDQLINQYKESDVFAYSADGKRIRIGGAVPYDMLKGILDVLLK